MNAVRRSSIAVACALALVVVATGGARAQTPGRCAAGKETCVARRAKAVLRCHEKAERAGSAVDTACLQRAEDKFDDGAGPAAGCFAKLESKGGCATTGDSPSLAAKSDAFVLDAVAEVDPAFPAPTLDRCAAGKKKCIATLSKALLRCQAKAAKAGALDTACLARARERFTGGVAPNNGCFAKLERRFACVTIGDAPALAAKVEAFVQDVVCELDPPRCTPCPTAVQFDPDPTAIDVDWGWTGFVHDGDGPFMGRLTLAAGSCSGGGAESCGTCSLTGPIPNTGGASFANQRCADRTWIPCTSDASCTAAGASGPCRFFLGPPLSTSAGGITLCAMNEITAPVTGSFDVASGNAALTVPMLMSLNNLMASGPELSNPCPPCVGGLCTAGPRAGFPCTVHGTSAAFEDDVSFDCPPDPSGFASAASIVLALTTGTQTRTLGTASPACRNSGYTTFKCMCDVCNSLPERPCFTHADCPDNPSGTPGVCGGRVCAGGSNHGGPCTTGSSCPSGVCSAFGKPTQHNGCDDQICTPNTPPDGDSIDEGICAAGPFEAYCAIETFRGCISNADCLRPGDTCTGARLRECFTDNGVLGGDVRVGGVAAPPAGGSADIVLGALVCVLPTGSSFDNAVYGFPGLGRATIPTLVTLQ